MKARQLRRRSGFHLLLLGARLAALGGMQGLRRCGESFGRWHFWLGWSKRTELQRQLEHLLSASQEAVHREPVDRVSEVLREAYRINDRAILEITAAYSGAITPAALAGSVTVQDIELLDQALAGGHGVVLLGMHSGNGVALAVHLGQLGYPVHVVYRESNKISPDFFRDGIQRQGLNAIPAVPPATGVRRMLAALKSGDILFILMDQGSKRGGIEVDFLGKRLQLPPGPVELARRTGAVIVPALLSGVDRQWHFRFDKPVAVDSSRPLEHEVKIVGDLMQRAILANPQWWSWHQRRWWRHPFSGNDAPRIGNA